MGGDGECKGNGREYAQVRGAVWLDDEVDLYLVINFARYYG